MLFKWIFTILIVLHFTCSSIPLPEKPAQLKKGDYSFLKTYLVALVHKKMQQMKTVGMSVAVVDNQKTIFARGFGYAHRSKGIEATADTVYRIGSISKLFTATAIMQLVETGKLKLNQPVSEVLSDFSKNSSQKPILIRDLLTHHAGLTGDILHNFAYGRKPPTGYETEFLKIPSSISSHKRVTEPGRVLAYCNACFSTLGAIVEKKSKSNYIQYINQNILQKLNMDHSSVIVSKKTLPHLARGYIFGDEVETPYIRDLPAGSFLSSANDLAKFMKMLFADGKAPGGTVLKAKTIKQMLSKQNHNIPLDFDFSIGITYWLLNKNGYQTASHGGDIPPFHALLVTIPEHKLGVVILTSTMGGSFPLGEIATKALELAYETKTGQKLPTPKISPELPIPNDVLEKFPGTYASSSGMMKIKRSGNSLAIHLMGADLELAYHKDKSFSVHYKLFGLWRLDLQPLKALKIKFHEQKNQKYLTFLAQDIQADIGTRIKPPKKEWPKEWLARKGDYQLINPGVVKNDQVYKKYYVLQNVSIDEEDGFPVLKSQFLGRRMSHPFQFTSSTEGKLYGEGRGLGEHFTFRRKNDREILHFSGYQFQKE